MVEVPGFEPGQTEPKSVVLPLHHTSVPGRKDSKLSLILEKISYKGAAFVFQDLGAYLSLGVKQGRGE